MISVSRSAEIQGQHLGLTREIRLGGIRLGVIRFEARLNRRLVLRQRPMRRSFAALLLGSLVPVGAAASPLVATVGQPAPAFVVEDLTGAPLSARMLRGKPLYMNVFATWCPPCRAELPEIVRSYGRYKEKVTFLGIDEQEPAGKIEPFARTMGIRYSIGIDQGQMEASYRAHSVPTSVFIDRHGIVRALYRGPIPEALLKKYLNMIAN